MSNLDHWLELHGLGKYAAAFTENDVGLDVLPHLTEDHLKELGVSLGDRLRLLKAIGALAGGETATPAASNDHQASAPAVAAGGEAERRQLTVMFCDLVGSTALASERDPEDMRELITSFQNACRTAIEPFGGFIARYMGDGILVYFGYPRAHEDDAERAVRSGLAVVDAVAALDADIGQRHGAKLGVRVGIATGPVVVGDIVGEGAAEEAAVVGETPNLAARLQAVAAPDQVVVAQATHKLLESSFDFESLGSQSLKGIAQPETVWRALRARDIHSRYEARRGSGATPLIGRQEELGLLLRSWEASKQGHGQAILIQGQAGIGKSHLIDALREQAGADDYVWVAHRCSPYHVNSTLYPVIEHLKRVLGWSEESSAAEKLASLESALANHSSPLAEVVPLYAELLSLPLPDGRYPPLNLNPREKREATLDALLAWLLEIAERTPVLNVWEDLHWADPTTLELLELYLEQSPTVSMMNVLTFRTDFVPTWSTRSHMIPVTLNRLERSEVETLVRLRAGGKPLPGEVLEHIVTKADGVPLYVEELTKAILESDFLREEQDRYALAGELSQFSIPATLQDSLMARLDRLPTLREVAQMGAVLGREFAYEMLRAVVNLEEPQLQTSLEQLVADEILYQRGRLPRSKYIFKHALIQDAAYQSLLKRTRQQCHRRVAQLLEEQFPEAVEKHPELAAHHYTEGAEPARAVEYWRLAGEHARAMSANLEAIAYFTRGIETLEKLPDDDARARKELALQLALGHANIIAKGHGSIAAEKAYTRAQTLTERLDDTSELVPALFGLWRSYVVGRTLDEAEKVALQLRRIAARSPAKELELVGNYTSGFTALCMGKLDEARASLENGIALYDPAEDSSNIYRSAQDPGVACRGYLAIATWLLGYPDRARRLVAESVALAEARDDRYSLAYALCYIGAVVSEMCADDDSGLDRGVEIATQDGYNLWILYGQMVRAMRALDATTSDSGIEQLDARIDAVLDIGVYLNTPYAMTCLANAYLRVDRCNEALQVLDDARQSLESRGENWWKAEVTRLRGEALLARSPGDEGEAEAHFQKALEIARTQNAKSLELRAVMSLARLRQRQNAADESRRMLRDCYAWFSEGFDTADLRAARQMLDATPN